MAFYFEMYNRKYVKTKTKYFQKLRVDKIGCRSHSTELISQSIDLCLNSEFNFFLNSQTLTMMLFFQSY